MLLELGIALLTLFGVVQQRTAVTETFRADAPTFAIEVEFRAVTALADDARGVAGIAVELGIASPKDSRPYAHCPVLARATSDADGLVRATLRIPEYRRDDPETWIWARVEEPGHHRFTVRRGLGSRRSPPRLIVRPGNSLFGIVRDARGDGVSGARVWLFREGEHGVELVRSVRSRSGGHFFLPFEDFGSHQLHARAGSSASAQGSGRIDPLELDAAARPEPVEVVIVGGASSASRCRGATTVSRPTCDFPRERLPPG